MVLLELLQEMGLCPKWVASTEGGEYFSPCPECGGVDRFRIQPNKQMKNCIGYYFCRQCGINGDAIQFARAFLGLSFREAINRVNAKINNTNPFHIIKKETRSMKPVSIIKPSALWQSKATVFTKWAHENIFKNNEILEWLRLRGLPLEAVKKYQIGWCPYEIKRKRALWGIGTFEDKDIWIPRGIVIPTLDKKGNVIRLKIRRDSYKEGDRVGKYIVISGSMNGLNIIGDTRHKIMIVYESELDAYATDYVAGDIVCSVAVGNNLKRPDEATNYHAKNMKQLLISHDNDQAGKTMLDRWQHWYHHAKPFPASKGKDIGEAISLGLDLRRWILMYGWLSSEDNALIEWILNYIKKQTTTRAAYINFEQEIVLGQTSPRALSGELQRGFRLMKKMVNLLDSLQ